MIGGFESR